MATRLPSRVSASNESSLAVRLERVKAEIRRSPENAEHRAAYFQLLCVQGDWERAADQLALIEKFDSKNVLFTQAYGRALRCEMERKRVHAGSDDPIIFGDPADWMGSLIESFRLARDQQWEAAAKAQAAAFEGAPETPGKINGVEIAWLVDADSRFGPMLEAFVEGHYRWVPFMRLSRLEIEAPTHIIDTVWMSAKFTWTNGGQVDGLIPTRYFGTESSEDETLRSAHGLVWNEPFDGYYVGIGVRQFAWDSGDKLIAEVREIQFASP